MKKRQFLLALAIIGAASLAACEAPQPASPDTHQPGPIDEECPRADNTPCK